MLTTFGRRLFHHRFVKKWKNLAVNGCFVSWVSYVSESRRYRGVVGRFVSRMRMRVVAMCFDGIARFAREGKRERAVLDKFRRRWGNMTMARGFGGWRGYVGRRKWCRGLLLRCVNGKLAGGLGKWADVIRWMKEEEDETTRREHVMEKFARNMRLRGAAKCVRAWRESVRVRKWLRGLMRRCVGGSYFALLGDGFEMWKGNVERIRREEAGMTVERLRVSVEAMGKELEVLREVKREYVCYKVLGRWKVVYEGLGRDAWMRWRNAVEHSKAEDGARQVMRLALMRHVRQQEHRAWRKWMIFARERTEKLKSCCGMVVHSLIRMRNFHLHRSFRKWLDMGRKEEQFKQQKLAERKLVVTKASQALAMLERGVMDASSVLGEEEEEDWGDIGY
jgi:hypothetical protein